jgi:hypothetical protein
MIKIVTVLSMFIMIKNANDNGGGGGDGSGGDDNSTCTNQYRCRFDLMLRTMTNIATLHNSHGNTYHKEHPALLH